MSENPRKFLINLLPKIVRDSGVIKTETLRLGTFHAVSFRSSGEMLITKGEEDMICIEADENLFEYLDIRVKNEKLIVDYASGVFMGLIFDIKPPRFFVTVRELEEVEATSSGNISLDEFQSGQFSLKSSGSGHINSKSIQTDALSIDLSSSGWLQMDYLKTLKLKARVSGSGSVVIKDGQAEDQDVKLYSSGRYIAIDLKPGMKRAGLVSLETDGSGQAEFGQLNTELFKGRLHSSGRILVNKLDASYLDVSLSGSGNFEIEEGTVNQQKIDLHSNGKLLAGALNTVQSPAVPSWVKIENTGSGNIELGETDAASIEIKVDSSGKVSLVQACCDLLKIKNDGSGDVYLDGGLVKQMELKFDSSGKLFADRVEAAETFSESSQITLNGSGTVRLGKIRSKLIKVDVQSSGGLFIEGVFADDFQVHQNGSGDVNVMGGKTERLKVKVESSGKYTGSDLFCQDADVTTNGSGSISVFAKGTLKGKIESSGSLIVSGNPTVDFTGNGSGKFKQAQS